MFAKFTNLGSLPSLSQSWLWTYFLDNRSLLGLRHIWQTYFSGTSSSFSMLLQMPCCQHRHRSHWEIERQKVHKLHHLLLGIKHFVIKGRSFQKAVSLLYTLTQKLIWNSDNTFVSGVNVSSLSQIKCDECRFSCKIWWVKNAI